MNMIYFKSDKLINDSVKYINIYRNELCSRYSLVCNMLLSAYKVCFLYEIIFCGK